MTSNLASGEIAEHALELRNEQRQNKLIEDSCENYFFSFIINFQIVLYLILFILMIQFRVIR